MNEGKMTRYHGKYRGTVVNNIDPEMRGRIMAMVPDVQGLVPTTWAMPCLPVLGLQMGVYATPMIGSGVWIEFEQGDPEYPIWTGCFAGSLVDVPAAAKLVPPLISAMTFQTTLQNSVVISDMPPTPLTGGIMLRSTTGAMIVVNDSGVYISNGKGATIMMVGPAVTINNGALTII
jgi:Type VI secretion system/phage-baseplate injector OB domain